MMPGYAKAVQQGLCGGWRIYMAQQWFGGCRLREFGSDREFSCLAAIWADSYHECSVLLDRHARAKGHSLLGMDGFHPENEASRAGHDALTLGQVGPENPVILGALTLTGGDAPARMPQNGPIIEALTPVQPLRRSDPAWQGGELPAPLMEMLFDRPVRSDDDGAPEGEADPPPMQTYAVLDAGKFGSGADEIEGCNMPFKSLFIGRAAQDLADIAPYVVQLDPRARFTRRLFRYDPQLPPEMTSMHIWHREAGIFIRTRLGLDELWRHFRKFTRVRDSKGAWFVLRFYDPNVLLDMAKHLEEDNRRRFFIPDIEVIALRKDGTGFRIRG